MNDEPGAEHGVAERLLARQPSGNLTATRRPALDRRPHLSLRDLSAGAAVTPDAAILSR